MADYIYNSEAVENLGIKDTSILDRLVDYESARGAHMEKDRAHRDKRLSLKEAIAEYVNDGDIYTDSGFSYVRAANQALLEVARQGKKKLQMIGSPNSCVSYLMQAGCVDYAHVSYQGAEMRGYDRAVSRYIKEGRLTVLSDWSHGAMALGFKAAQIGSPGMFSKQLLGSDIVKYNPYVKVMDHPMKDVSDPVVFIPALYPDVTVIHVQHADMYGNARIYGPSVNDVAMAAAARKVIITAEEIVPESSFREENKGVAIPFLYVDAVVELPWGALPGSCPGYYFWSRQWWEKYFRFANLSDENFREFNEYWLLSCKDQFDFLEKLGGARFIAEARRQTRAAEGDNELDGVDMDYREWMPGMAPEDEQWF